MKHFEEDVGQNLHNVGFGNNFLHMTLKAQVTKEKIDKLDFKKILKFCAPKDTINREKGNPQNGRKYLQIIFAEGLLSRIYRKLKLNNKKTA